MCIIIYILYVLSGMIFVAVLNIAACGHVTVLLQFVKISPPQKCN